MVVSRNRALGHNKDSQPTGTHRSFCKKHTAASFLTGSNSKCLGSLGIGFGERGLQTAAPVGVPRLEGIPERRSPALPFVSRAVPGGLPTGKTRSPTGELAGPDHRPRGIPGHLTSSLAGLPALNSLAGTLRCALLRAGFPAAAPARGSLPLFWLRTGVSWSVSSARGQGQPLKSPAPRLPEGRGQGQDPGQGHGAGRTEHASGVCRL